MNRLVLTACLAFFAGPVAADVISTGVDADFSGNAGSPVFQPSSGATIPYELWVSIDPGGDGRSSQGLALFTYDVITNTGLQQSVLTFSRVKTMGPGRVTSPNWVWDSYQYQATQIGGFGFDFLTDTGNNVTQPGNVLGAGASMPLEWTADVGTFDQPGLQPHALHNVGYGTPPGTDVGGNPTPPADARDKWYLMSGTISVPHDPGDYTVQIVPTATTVIRIVVDLNLDQTAYQITAANNGDALTGSSFTFQVKPEPATLSLLLLGGAGLLLRPR